MSDASTDFEKVYSDYYVEIRRFIFTIARRDQEITNDVSQNTWQNAFRYYEGLRDKTVVRSWLYTIARNEAKRYFANRHVAFFSKTAALEEEEGTGNFADEQSSAFPEALANRELLAKLLGKLDLNEQRLILLHYAYDVDLKAIADLEGANYNTLKSAFRRAMERLRKAAKEIELY